MEHLLRRRSNTQTNEGLVSKPRTDEVICFLMQAAKIRNKRSDAWQRSVNKAQRKWAKRFTRDDFSFESLQHIEVIIDRDDYFPFSVTAIQRDSQLLLFLTLLSSLVCAKAFGKSQSGPTERVTHHASGCQSWFTGLGQKNKNWTSFSLFMPPLVSFSSASLTLCCFFLSVRSAPAAVSHAGPIIMCFDTVGSPAAFSQHPQSHRSSSMPTQWYKTTRPPLLFWLQAVNVLGVQWVQPALRVRSSTLAL